MRNQPWWKCTSFSGSERIRITEYTGVSDLGPQGVTCLSPTFVVSHP